VNVMVGLDVVAGYLVAWAVSKARRAGGRLDQDVDEVMDAGLDRLHAAIEAKLGPDRAVGALELEAAEGEVTSRTRERAEAVLAAAAGNDPDFAAELGRLAAGLREITQTAVTAQGERSVAIGGDVRVTARDGGVAAVQAGDITVGGRPDPTVPGQPGR
jgi:hypothetical protein